MKKLLLSTALAAGLASPVYAKAPTVPVCGSGPFCFTVPEQADEISMFNDVANKDTMGPFFGTIHGNGLPHFTPDFTITTNQNVTSGSGNANIKDGDNSAWTDIKFVVNPTATNAKTGDSVTTMVDGFYTREQLIQFVAPCDGPCAAAPAAATGGFTIWVNKGLADEAHFDFTGLALHSDLGSLGFDEPMLLSGGKLVDDTSKAELIHTVEMVADAGTAFFEVKQIDWSACSTLVPCGDNPVINPTGGVPEIPTWAMGLMGFALIGAAGSYRRKEARYAL